MKNKRIVNAYDTVNPTKEQKQRMLRSILKEADFGEEPTSRPRKREPIIYTAKPTKTSKKSTWTAIAASLALLAVSAAVVVQMMRQPEAPAYVSPTETTAPTEETTLPAEPTHYGVYNYVIAEYVGYLNGTLPNPTTIPQKLRELIDIRDTAGLGWIVYDVNGDGIEELLIADGELIYQAISMNEEGTECPILFTTMEEERYFRCQDEVFCKVSGYGGDYVQYDFFKVDMNRLDPNFRNIQEVVICDHGEYRIGKTEETAVSVDKSTGEWTLGEKYLRERLYVTPFLEQKQEEEPAKNLTGFAPYDEIIQRYAQAVDQCWDTVNMEINHMSAMIFENNAYVDLGWCLLDIDGNGQEELLISDGETIYDSYTITASGELAPLIMSSFEKTLTLCQNGIFKAVYPNEGYTVYIYYKVTGEFATPEKTIVYKNGAYQAGQTEALAQPISKDEAGRMMSQYIEQELFVTRFMARDPDVYDADSTYAETLQIYRRALTEKWTLAQCMDAGISTLISGYAETPGDIGYTFRNLDGGEEELIVTDGQSILGLYTVTDGEVACVLTSEARTQYTLLEDKMIFFRGSAGAALTYYSLYSMNRIEDPSVSEESVLRAMGGYMYDANTDPENPWFYYDGKKQGGQCIDFDAEAWVTEMENSRQQLDFRPFN